MVIDKSFTCPGKVTSWEYYRTSSGADAFIGVWRRESEFHYRFIQKTTLPDAPIGLHTVVADPPIDVLPGDFIGIHSGDPSSSSVFRGGDGTHGAPETELGRVVHAELFETDIRGNEGTVFHILMEYQAEEAIGVRANFVPVPSGN